MADEIKADEIMADEDEINEITLESNRCLYVKLDTAASEIYFSNYYLKQLIDKNTVLTPFKIKFTGTKFMNDTLISDETKPTIDSTIKEINNLSPINISPESLNMSLYSKLTYTPPAADGDGAAEVAEATPLELKTDIAEKVILGIKYNDTNSIFANIEQVRQYLKYDGLWYRGRPRKYKFDERERTQPVEAKMEGEDNVDDAQQGSEGGKKTKTRRRGKASHNKHRKSKRIR